MTERVQRLTDEARKLDPEELSDLLDELLVMMCEPDPEVEKAWAAEAERRLDAYLKGETTARDAREVLAKYTKP